MSEQSVFAAELSWPDYEASVRDGATPILLPIGSMEQHGHHMPMNVDVLLPVEFARRVAGRIDALVAPPFTYGYKSHQKSGAATTCPAPPASTAPRWWRRCATSSGIRSPRSAPHLPVQRPLREFLVHHRRHRSGCASSNGAASTT